MACILITGASSGIGRALALNLAHAGHHVIAVARNLHKLKILNASAEQNLSIIQADISEEEGRDKIIAFLYDNKFNVTHVVHSAGDIHPITALRTLTVEDYRYQHRVNTEAPLFLTQQLLLTAAPGCRFLFITSGAAFSPYQGIASYALSKAALDMLWRAFKQEHELEAVYFAGLRPGAVHTSMVDFAREQDAQTFPLLHQLEQKIQDKTILSPEFSSSFIAWVLLKTSDRQFEKSWNINDEDDKKQWQTS